MNSNEISIKGKSELNQTITACNYASIKNIYYLFILIINEKLFDLINFN